MKKKTVLMLKKKKLYKEINLAELLSTCQGKNETHYELTEKDLCGKDNFTLN